eukprot:1195993-Prorocentrum_minimum.AAC.6
MLPEDNTGALEHSVHLQSIYSALELAMRFDARQGHVATVGLVLNQHFINTEPFHPFSASSQDFHPRLAFVVDALRVCGMELLHFLVVMLYLGVVQGFAVNLVLGPVLKRCATLSEAMLYSLDLFIAGAFGDMGIIEEQAALVSTLTPILMAPIVTDYCHCHPILANKQIHPRIG